MTENAILAKYYREDLYPVELIYRMMSCDKKDQSAEARVIGVQYKGSNLFVAYEYKRDSLQSLRHKMFFASSSFPQSMHMAHFKESGGNKLVRLKKELVFDMDVTDFTRYCACHDVKRLCPACWPQLQGASLILQHIVENHLGYEQRHCLWVFSGRRGLHCFINDPCAMSLSDTERQQLYKRLSIATGDDARLIAFITSLSRREPEFLASIEKFFLDSVLREQDLLNTTTTDAKRETLEAFCLRHLRQRHQALYHLVKSAWDKLTVSQSPTKKTRLDMTPSDNLSMRKWKALLSLESLAVSPYKASAFICVRFFYPVIDKGPLRLTHQIKLPFSVHASTLNVALPLSQEDIMQMNIMTDTLKVDVLCKEKKQPPVFVEGVRLLQEWVEMYTEFIEETEEEEGSAMMM